jgi:hypothetical protein
MNLPEITAAVLAGLGIAGYAATLCSRPIKRKTATVSGLEECITYDAIGGLAGGSFPVDAFKYDTDCGEKFIDKTKYEIGDKVMLTYYRFGHIEAEPLAENSQHKL